MVRCHFCHRSGKRRQLFVTPMPTSEGQRDKGLGQWNNRPKRGETQDHGQQEREQRARG